MKNSSQKKRVMSAAIAFIEKAQKAAKELYMKKYKD